MTLLMLLVKASLIVLVTALVLAAVGRRASAATRHLIGTFGVVGLLALPLLSLSLPSWSVVRLPSRAVLTVRPAVASDSIGPSDVRTDAAVANESAPFRIAASDLGRLVPRLPVSVLSPSFWLAIYVLGVLLLMARLLLDRLAVGRIARGADELSDARWRALFEASAAQLRVSPQPRLLRSRRRTTPMMVGTWRPAIVVPPLADGWTDEVRRVVLLHELAHVVRRDTLTQTAAKMACACYWIHPGVWWLARTLREERELACDDLVLSAGADAQEYAGQLLELAYALRGHLTPALAAGMAGSRQLETRLQALVDEARNRNRPGRVLRFAAMATLIAALLPIASTAVVAVQANDAAAAQPDRPTRHEVSSRSFEAELQWIRDSVRRAATSGFNRLMDQVGYLTEMRQLGYSAVDPGVLFSLRQHGVSPQYIRALAAEGVSRLSSTDLLTVAQHGVSAEFVHDLKAVGFTQLDVPVLTRLRRHGVMPDYIRDFQRFGYKWSVEELVEARSHGIDQEYVQGLASLGYQQLPLGALTLLRSHGVDPGYISQLHDLGYTAITPNDLANLRSHGVTPEQARTANQRAGERLTINQLTQLASHGWKPERVR